MAPVSEKNGADIHTRISQLEVEFASTRSDIKSLFNIVTGISNKLDSMVERNRPNTLGAMGLAVSLVLMIATIGALAFAPIYRDLDSMSRDDHEMANAIVQIQRTRFTPEDARLLRSDTKADLEELKDTTNERFYRNESEISNLLKSTANHTHTP